MTEIILTFPVRRTAVLICVWYETGNPARPLACRWIAQEPADAGSRSALAVDPLVRRICA